MLQAATRDTVYIGFLNKTFSDYQADSFKGGASSVSSKFLNKGSVLRLLMGSFKNISITINKIRDKTAILAKGKLYSYSFQNQLSKILHESAGREVKPPREGATIIAII